MLNSFRTRLLSLAVLAAVALAAAACEDDAADTPDENGPTATTTAATPDGTPSTTGEALTPEEILQKDPDITKRETVTWGAMFELSGPLQGFGEPAADGLRIAVEEINAAGGFQVGDTIYTIELVERDTRSEVANSVSVATELIRDEGLNIVWGPAAVGDAETTVLTQQNGVLHLCPCPEREFVSLSSLEQVLEDNPLAFQTLPAASKFLRPGAQDTRAEFPEYETFATICVNTQVGHSFCDFFAEAYEEAGFEHVAEEFFPPETSDYNPFLTNIKGSNPDIVLNFVDAGTGQFSLLRSAWELDVGKFHIAVALPYELFEGLVGQGIRNKIVAAGAAPRNHAIYTSDKAEDFFENTYKGFKGATLPPGAFAALLLYDPAYMLIAAMQSAGTVSDVEAIAEALVDVRFNGVGEDNMYFDEQHRMITGNDACRLFQGNMTCEHIPPATEASAE
jgi:ABC-type branched-subunit amino acid transport system substrate-binding protein